MNSNPLVSLDPVPHDAEQCVPADRRDGDHTCDHRILHHSCRHSHSPVWDSERGGKALYVARVL